MSQLRNIWDSLADIGVAKGDSLYQIKLKRFFNLIMFFGALSGIPQVIVYWPVDLYAGLFHLSWTVVTFLAILIHKAGNFKLARFLHLFVVFTLGGMASVRLGSDLNPHIASLGVVVASFILHDLRKEWHLILFFMLTEFAMITMVEYDVWTAENLDLTDAPFIRSFIMIGTIGFVLFELVVLVNLSSTNEREANRELKISNDQLRQSNEEKNVLLQEVHHRVKNNLQIITSLLSLQSYEIDDNTAKEKFVDSINRVRSISALHELIYQSENLLKIELDDYIKKISQSLIDSYDFNKDIDLYIHTELENIHNNSIVPISLILNELMSNSIKYGFDSINECEIHIKIEKLNTDTFSLIYQDNGVWKEHHGGPSFGIELVETLTDQLNGKILVHPSVEESKYHIEFKITEKE